MIQEEDGKFLRSINIGDNNMQDSEMLIDSDDNNGRYAPHFGFGILFTFLLAIGFIPATIYSSTETAHKKLPFQESTSIFPIISKFSVPRPLYKGVEVYLKIQNLSPTKKFAISYSLNVTFGSKHRHPIILRNTRNIFPSFISKKSDFVQLIFQDNIVDYSHLEIIGYINNFPELKNVQIIYKYSSSSYSSLLMWLKLYFPIVHIIVICIRFCRKTRIEYEQKLCALLTAATLVYDNPFSILNLYIPTPLMIYFDIICTKIYGPALLYVSLALLARVFDRQLTQNIKYIPVIYFGITFFLSSINFLVHYPSEIPDQLGSLAFDLEILNLFLSFVFFIILIYYMVLWVQEFAGDPGIRLATYKSMISFVSCGTAFFYVLQAEQYMRESLFSGIFQLGLINSVALIMEYLHSNKDILIKDVYETPKSRRYASDNAIGEALSDTNGYYSQPFEEEEYFVDSEYTQ